MRAIMRLLCAPSLVYTITKSFWLDVEQMFFTSLSRMFLTMRYSLRVKSLHNLFGRSHTALHMCLIFWCLVGFFFLTSQKI